MKIPQLGFYTKFAYLPKVKLPSSITLQHETMLANLALIIMRQYR